jgi:Fe/S biogenesis protein NfuA
LLVTGGRLLAEMHNTLTITEPALTKIIEIRDQEESNDEVALLVEISGVTGADFSYALSFVPITHVAGTCRIERHGDLTVAVDDQDVDLLTGATLDIRAGGLAMDNPNRPEIPTFGDGTFGTLEGTLAERVATVIDQQVNPAIASHGGAARLVGVDGNDINLQLLGGCQGCGLAAVTLRQGIERILRQAVPEVGEIRDVTDHLAGTNPYYH